MSEPEPSVVECPLIVLRVTVAEATGDVLADLLRDQLMARYELSEAIHAVVDLQRVTYLSSIAIGPLLALKRMVREREGRIVLCGMSDEVEGVFHATKLIAATPGMAATFEYQPDVLEALRRLLDPVAE